MNYCNHQRQSCQGKIESILRHGESNAMTSSSLCELTGAASPRVLRSMIERERAGGALILSTVRGHGGYYLPDANPEKGRAEIEAFIRTVHTRAVNSRRALKSARQALKQCAGQEAIE